MIEKTNLRATENRGAFSWETLNPEIVRTLGTKEIEDAYEVARRIPLRDYDSEITKLFERIAREYERGRGN